MTKYIDKSALVAEIERRFLEDYNTDDVEMDEVAQGVLASLKYFIDTLEAKESDETAEAFARIIRANLIGIDKDVQHKFEQLYKEITGEKMYQGYND